MIIMYEHGRLVCTLLFRPLLFYLPGLALYLQNTLSPSSPKSTPLLLF